MGEREVEWAGEGVWELSFTWDVPAFHPDLTGLGLTRKQRRALLGILTEAILATTAGLPVRYSRSKNAWSQSRYFSTCFGYHPIMRAIHEADAAGLILNEIAPRSSLGGQQSTFRATPALLALVPSNPWGQATQAETETVILKDAHGDRVDYRDNNATRRMRRELAAINERLAGTCIGLAGIPEVNGVCRIDEHRVFAPARRRLYRVFNGDWLSGGRLYGASWQGLPKELRKRLLIDDEATVEADYPQLHPRLVYALFGRWPDGDAYDVPGIERSLAKRAFNILINAESLRGAYGAIRKHLKIARPSGIVRAIRQRHASIAPAFHSGTGIILQRHDSEIAMTVLKLLARDGITALPIHDSFVVQARHALTLKAVMLHVLTRMLEALPLSTYNQGEIQVPS